MPFPTKGGTLFGSLTHATHADRTTGRAVQRAVVAATNPESARELGGALAALAADSGSVDARSVSDTPDQDALRRVLESRIVHALSALWHEPLSLVLWRPEPWFPTAGARFFVLTPDDGVHDGRPLRIACDDELSRLEPVLHATHQVALHLHEGRQAQRATPAPRVARPRALVCLEDLRPGGTMSHFGPAHEYHDLLERSLLVELADVAALYLMDRSGSNLSLVASLGTSRAPRTVAMDPERSALAFVVNRDRPRVANHATREPGETSSVELPWYGENPEPDDFSAIVVPVANMAMTGSAMGALVVQKRADTHDDVFDIHDLNQLELLSSRVALRRSNLLFQESTDRLSELTGHTMLASSASLEVESTDAPWPELPADVVSARRSLERAVRLAYRYTPALATVLYLTDRRQEHLIPAVTEGTPMFGQRQIPTFENGAIKLPASHKKVRGLVANVLTTGQPILIGDVRSPEAWSGFGGRLGRHEWSETPIRCVLALPITIFDRTVGVLELVSERPDTLEPSRSFSQAVGHQISTAMLIAQRAEEQRAFVFAASTALHAHEILKRVDMLKQLGDARAEAIGDEIRRLVHSLDDPEFGEGLAARDPLEILQGSIERAALKEFAVWISAPPPLPPVSPSVAIALERAADEVFANAHARLASDGRSTRVQLSAKWKLRGGLPRLVVEIEHCASCTIPAAIEAKIYRTPIEDAHDGGRRHYGAFTAGYWMRAVGGDVYIWRNELDRNGRAYIGTAIEVPMLTLAPAEGGE